MAKRFQSQWRDATHVAWIGRINEESSIDDAFTRNAPVIWIDFGGVAGINSAGIWRWLNGLVASKSKFVYTQVPATVAAAFSVVQSLVGEKAFVESFYAVYVCGSCQNVTQKLLRSGVDIPIGQVAYVDAPRIVCKDCGAAMELDQLPGSFFDFLAHMMSESPR